MKIPAWTVLPTSLLFSFAAYGDSFKQIIHSVDASSLESVEFDISVAEIDIEIYDGDEIQLEIDIEAQRSWFSWRKRDVDNIELDVEGDGSSVYLGIDANNIQQHWRIKLPAKLALNMDLGVGDIHIKGFSNDLHLELGVGAVRVEVDDTDYGQIHVSAGVGDANIRGFTHRADNERSFVSADAYYHGEGDLEMSIEVGVGDVEVRNR